MTVRTSSNCKLFIGPVAADTVDTEGEFEALTPYVEVLQIQNIGEFGDAANDVSVAHLNDARMQHYKGVYDAGVLNVVVSYDPATGSGQEDLIAASQAPDNYAFKITLNDDLPGSPVQPTTFYFRGQVRSYRVNVGGSDQIISANVEIGINSAIITVAAD